MPDRTHKITLDPTFKQGRWFSQQCDYQIDRDVNAAINLKHLAVG